MNKITPNILDLYKASTSVFSQQNIPQPPVQPTKSAADDWRADQGERLAASGMSIKGIPIKYIENRLGPNPIVRMKGIPTPEQISGNPKQYAGRPMMRSADRANILTTMVGPQQKKFRLQQKNIVAKSQNISPTVFDLYEMAKADPSTDTGARYASEAMARMPSRDISDLASHHKMGYHEAVRDYFNNQNLHPDEIEEIAHTAGHGGDQFHSAAEERLIQNQMHDPQQAHEEGYVTAMRAMPQVAQKFKAEGIQPGVYNENWFDNLAERNQQEGM